MNLTNTLANISVSVICSSVITYRFQKSDISRALMNINVKFYGKMKTRQDITSRNTIVHFQYNNHFPFKFLLNHLVDVGIFYWMTVIPECGTRWKHKSSFILILWEPIMSVHLKAAKTINKHLLWCSLEQSSEKTNSMAMKKNVSRIYVKNIKYSSSS